MIRRLLSGRAARRLHPGLFALTSTIAMCVPSTLVAQVTEYRWQANFDNHVVPNFVSLVDSDNDGRAELVRVSVRVRQPKGREWAITPVRLGIQPEQPGPSVSFGGPVGSLALDARIRSPGLVRRFSTKDSSEVTLEFEFDAEEVRHKLGGRAGTLLFDVHRVLNEESMSPDADRYRSEVAAIPKDQLGWLPGRLLGVGADVQDGTVEFKTRIEADRDAECPIRASVRGLTRSAWVDSLVVIPVKAGVTPATFSISLPPGLPSELDSLSVHLHVTDIQGPLFPGKLWQRVGNRPQHGWQ